jgi:RNA polymerase sigma factor (sigma-70 family)
MASCRSWLGRHVRKRFPHELAPRLDSSDLVQEVQARAAARLDCFHGTSLGEFRAFLLGILRRVVLRERRHAGQGRRDWRREMPLGSPRGSAPELSATATAIPERLGREEECQRLSLAAGWCRHEDRAIIRMHLAEGRSHEEIAAEEGEKAATIRQRYCRAVRRVRAALDLLDAMTESGLTTLQQDVIGLHRCQGADPGRIAGQLRLPEGLVQRWIADARPWLRAGPKDQP